MASRCAISASETRYRRIRLMASKSTSSNSPSPLRSHSQRQLALSDPGCPIRPMIDPTATARCRPLNPSPSSNLPSPSLSIAHNPTCSTPTVRGRSNSSDSTSTVCRSVPPAATSAPRCTSCMAIRCASRSTSSGHSSSTSTPCRSSNCSIRLHNTAQCSVATANSLPRLSSVRWRTRSPLRSERTSR